jgi:hypothetical protein
VIVTPPTSLFWKPRRIRYHFTALALAALSGIVFPASAQVPFGESAGAVTYFAPSNFTSPNIDPAEAPRARVYIRTHSERPAVRDTSNSFCVRTCDGRFFPVPNVSGADEVKACEAVCPSTEVQVFSGPGIDNATTERGLAYSKLLNAFRFRREMVASCTCNARTVIGMTRISIENDSTVRSGDIVAEENGFAIASDGSGHRRIMFRQLSQARAKALGLTRISAR